MPDYPDSIRQAAYAACYGEPTDTYAWDRVADAVLDAVAADLGEYVADRIRAHMKENEPSGPGQQHFQAAAMVAAGAFVTADDMKRAATELLGRGDFVAWPGQASVVCERCWSLVRQLDQERHDLWHADMSLHSHPAGVVVHPPGCCCGDCP